MKTDSIRDTNDLSRKGRKPKNDRAMTPAERKRLQRQREKERQSDVPNWLHFRREILSYVINRFPLCNAVEVANALDAVAMGLVWLTTIRDHSVDKRLDGLLAVINPDKSNTAKDQILFEFRPYCVDDDQEKEHPGFHSAKVYEAVCDIFERHENDEADK